MGLDIPEERPKEKYMVKEKEALQVKDLVSVGCEEFSSSNERRWRRGDYGST